MGESTAGAGCAHDYLFLPFPAMASSKAGSFSILF